LQFRGSGFPGWADQFHDNRRVVDRVPARWSFHPAIQVAATVLCPAKPAPTTRAPSTPNRKQEQHMAKGQKKSNREAKKPKKVKAPQPVAAQPSRKDAVPNLTKR